MTASAEDPSSAGHRVHRDKVTWRPSQPASEVFTFSGDQALLTQFSARLAG